MFRQSLMLDYDENEKETGLGCYPWPVFWTSNLCVLKAK